MYMDLGVVCRNDITCTFRLTNLLSKLGHDEILKCVLLIQYMHMNEVSSVKGKVTYWS